MLVVKRNLCWRFSYPTCN